MAITSEPTVATIIQLAKISEYLASNDLAKFSAFNKGNLDPRLAKMIYAERKAVDRVFALNPSDSTLSKTANYLYSILGKYAIQAQNILNGLTAAVPIISGPSNASVSVGGNASFTISVVSTTPYTVQWYDYLGNQISGATSTTYTFTNSQLTDSGKTFFAKVTNTVGIATSVVATLTVTSVITGYFSYSATTDYYPILLTNIDNFTYQTNFNITHNSQLVITLPAAMPSNQYMLVKVPVGENIKTSWFNTALNNGSIPDSAFQSIVQFGGFTYYASRGQITMDTTATLTMS